MAEGKVQPWVWVTCGCLAGCLIVVLVVVLTIVGVPVGLAVLGQRWAEDMADPEKRAESVMEILDTNELPEGYNAIAGITIPLFAEMAVLGTNEPDAHGQLDELGERGFVYMKLKLSMPEKEQELRDFLAGRSEKKPDIMLQSNIRLDADEVVERGKMELDGSNAIYTIYRGAINVDNKTGEGLAAMTMIECPEDHRIRLGIWFGPDPSQGEATEEADLTGTPGDKQAIKVFLSHFDFCN